MTTWYTRKPLACRHGHSFPSRPWGLCPVSAAPPSERLRALPQPCCCLFLCRLLRCRSRSLLFLYLLDSLCGCGGGGCCCCCCLLLCLLYSCLFCSPLYLLPLPLPPAVQWHQQPQPQPPPVLSLQPPLLQPSWLLCLFLCRLLHCRSRSLLFLHLLDSLCGCGGGGCCCCCCLLLCLLYSRLFCSPLYLLPLPLPPAVQRREQPQPQPPLPSPP